MKRVLAPLFAEAVLALTAWLAHAIDLGGVKIALREAARAVEAGGMRATDALEAQNAASNYQTAADLPGAICPHVAGGAAASVAMMGTLFAEDFRAEEARFAAAVPASDRHLQTGGPSSPDDLHPRRP